MGTVLYAWCSLNAPRTRDHTVCCPAPVYCALSYSLMPCPLSRLVIVPVSDPPSPTTLLSLFWEHRIVHPSPTRTIPFLPPPSTRASTGSPWPSLSPPTPTTSAIVPHLHLRCVAFALATVIKSPRPRTPLTLSSDSSSQQAHGIDPFHRLEKEKPGSE